MIIFKTYFAMIALSALTLISCKKDDDNNSDEDQGAGLVSTGTCGEFFNGIPLTNICGVAANNSQSFGSSAVCTYVIRENPGDGQELYAVTLYDFGSIEESRDFFIILKNDADPGTATTINDVGDEAIFIEDQNNMDYSIAFRFKNVNVVVAADELLFELGCNNPQARLKELASLVINKL